MSDVIAKRWLLAGAAVLLAVCIPIERGNRWHPTPAWDMPEPTDARDRELWKAQRKAESAIEWNQWVLLVPHVKGMRPWFIIDRSRSEAGHKAIGKTGIRVWVDKPEHVRFVQWFVPSQLEGVPVVVEATPVAHRVED
jgi:hypothetical protein